MAQHEECHKEALCVALRREKHNLQNVGIHLVESFDEFLLNCTDTQMKRQLERERHVLQNFVVQSYKSLDYMREVLFPKEFEIVPPDERERE